MHSILHSILYEITRWHRWRNKGMHLHRQCELFDICCWQRFVIFHRMQKHLARRRRWYHLNAQKRCQHLNWICLKYFPDFQSLLWWHWIDERHCVIHFHWIWMNFAAIQNRCHQNSRPKHQNNISSHLFGFSMNVQAFDCVQLTISANRFKFSWAIFTLFSKSTNDTDKSISDSIDVAISLRNHTHSMELMR